MIEIKHKTTGAVLHAVDAEALKGADLRNLNLTECDFVGADLSGTDLSGTILANADLTDADLSNANFAILMPSRQDFVAWLDGWRRAGPKFPRMRATNLSGATLAGADLTSANFRGADLTKADLGRTTCVDADFQDADLTDADLADASGLLPEQLAGSVLVRARLPKSVETFEALKNAEEMSKNAGKYFVALVAGCLFALLTIASTSDVGFFTDTASATLPLIQTQVPTVGFFILAPILLFGTFLYLHLELQRQWEQLATLPAVFPDGIPLNRKAYPWLLNGFLPVYIYRLRLRRGYFKRPALASLQHWSSFVLVWGTTPLVLMLFWGKYLRRHEPIGTGLHVALVTLAILAAGLLHQLSARTLSRGHLYGGELPAWKYWRIYAWLGAALILYVFFTKASFGAIHGVIPYRLEQGFAGEQARSSTGDVVVIPQEYRSWKEDDLRKRVPRLFELIGFSPFADLSDADISVRPSGWTGRDDPTYALIKGARLSGKDLRYAKGHSAFLVKADLAHAQLDGAMLTGADLRAAYLRGTVVKANLNAANLADANLDGADLRESDISGARFAGAYLSGVDLSHKYLAGMEFQRANLQDASFFNANLIGTHLERAQLYGANFQAAEMKEALLNDAELMNADFRQANLAGADLRGADLRNADFRRAHLEGADLRGSARKYTKISGVPGISVPITQQQLDSAFTDAATQVSPPLKVRRMH